MTCGKIGRAQGMVVAALAIPASCSTLRARGDAARLSSIVPGTPRILVGRSSDQDAVVAAVREWLFGRSYRTEPELADADLRELGLFSVSIPEEPWRARASI